jgi:hypothetical protein
MMIRNALPPDYDQMEQILKDAGVRITALRLHRCESFVYTHENNIVGLFSLIRIKRFIYPVLIHFIVCPLYRKSLIAVYMIRAIKVFCRTRGWKRIVIDSSGKARVDNFTRRKFNIIREYIGLRNHKYFIAEIL